MAENSSYKKEEAKREDKREAEDRRKGQKLLSHPGYKSYQLEPEEAYRADKANSIIYRNNKFRVQAKDFQNFDLNDSENE